MIALPIALPIQLAKRLANMTAMATRHVPMTAATGSTLIVNISFLSDPHGQGRRRIVTVVVTDRRHPVRNGSRGEEVESSPRSFGSERG